MPFRVSVAFHIGAHKTATTHIQQTFSRNRALIEGGGVGLVGPDFLRQPGQAIEELFGLMGHPAQMGGEERALELSGGRGRLFLSEENFIGAFRDSRGDLKVPLYPDAPDRLEQLARALAPAPLDAYLAVRDPVEWLASCYSQVLLSDMFIAPAEYFAVNPPAAVDWVDLVARLRAVQGLRTLSVWPYENYRRGAQFIYRQMLRRRVGALVEPHSNLSHERLSVRAVDEVLNHPGPRAAIKARKQFPAGDQWPKFDPCEPELRHEADALYRDQLQQIAAIKGVQFMG